MKAIDRAEGRIKQLIKMGWPANFKEVAEIAESSL
jgi:hypothetical protein